MSRRRESELTSFWRSRGGIGFIVFLAVTGYFIWEGHQAHILGYLPLILLLGICVVMHFFMHARHDGDNPTQGRDE